ncbi:MAG TPA: hypothetical protein VGZ25_05160, partial [Gemmataceae bacterium]|nr:hypothetical protein [Gemmataceae bacterium]
MAFRPNPYLRLSNIGWYLESGWLQNMLGSGVASAPTMKKKKGKSHLLTLERKPTAEETRIRRMH